MQSMNPSKSPFCRYIGLLDRLLGVRLRTVTEASVMGTHSISYEFMNRQLLWCTFTVKQSSFLMDMFFKARSRMIGIHCQYRAIHFLDDNNDKKKDETQKLKEH
jgi:hypothetical protein